MKKINLFIVLLCISFLQSCMQEDEQVAESKPAKVTFTFGTSDAHGRTSSDKIENVTGVLLSLTTPSGQEIVSRKKLTVNNFSGNLITEYIELPAGRYVITDFLLIDDLSNVLYATPQKGSFLAPLLKQPLGQQFSVNWGKENTLSMEVIATEGLSPEDFGYKSFSEKALSYFSLSVHNMKSGKSVFTNAKAFLLDGTDTVGAYTIEPKINLIKFSGELDGVYSLVIIKDGYARYTKVFKFSDLKTELNNKPLRVNLVPALTLRLLYQYNDSEYAEHRITFDLETNGHATFLVNWGDGEENEVTMNDFGYFNHAFPSDSTSYFVSITGDLDKIIGYTGDYNEFALSPINVDVLHELKYVNMYLSGTPALLDLRQNEKLEGLILGADTVLLPKKNHLHDIRLFDELSNSVDYFIDNIYKNAVANNIYNGRFDINDSAYDYSEDDPTIAIDTPNQASRKKLKILRDTYHWKIYPTYIVF